MSEEKKKRRVGGNRCVVGGCSNTSRDGFTVYQMPTEPLSTQRGWVNFIQNTRKDFDWNKYSRVFVCCGHFFIDQFDKVAVSMYLNGFRKSSTSTSSRGIPSFIHSCTWISDYFSVFPP